MKQTFDYVSQPQAETAPEVASTPQVESEPVNAGAVILRPNFAPTPYVSDGDAEGEFDASDREKATMTIVAKTGQASNVFTPGDIVFNKEFVVGGIKQSLELVAIGIKKRYQNDLDFDGGEMGDVVDKAVEVNNRGGIVDYRPYDDKTSTHYWKPILQVVFLVKRPDNLSPEAGVLFPFTIGGSDYAEVGYTARTKTAYNGIAKPLIGLKQSEASVRGVNFKLTTKGLSSTDNKKSWIQPDLRTTGPVSPEMAAFLNKNYGG